MVSSFKWILYMFVKIFINVQASIKATNFFIAFSPDYAPNGPSPPSLECTFSDFPSFLVTVISISPVTLSYDLLVISAFGYNALIYYYAKFDWDQYPHPPQYVIDTKYI